MYLALLTDYKPAHDFRLTVHGIYGGNMKQLFRKLLLLLRRYGRLLSSREGIVLLTATAMVVGYDHSLLMEGMRLFPPPGGIFNQHLAGIVWFFLLPLAVNAVHPRMGWKEMGGGTGSPRRWLPWFFLLVIAGTLWAWIVSRNPAYRAFYPQYAPAGESVGAFLVFQLSVGLYMFAWEFFCRGFLMFGLKPRFGRSAILVQLVLFTLLHRGKPEYLLSMLGGLGMGIFAYQAGTFFPVFLLHWVVSILLDIFCLF